MFLYADVSFRSGRRTLRSRRPRRHLRARCKARCRRARRDGRRRDEPDRVSVRRRGRERVGPRRGSRRWGARGDRGFRRALSRRPYSPGGEPARTRSAIAALSRFVDTCHTRGETLGVTVPSRKPEVTLASGGRETTADGIGETRCRLPREADRRRGERPRLVLRPTLERANRRREISAGAMCVRRVDDRFVLRFTFLLAVRLGLPRPASRVIHRSEPYTLFAERSHLQGNGPVFRTLLLSTTAEGDVAGAGVGPHVVYGTLASAPPRGIESRAASRSLANADLSVRSPFAVGSRRGVPADGGREPLPPRRRSFPTPPSRARPSAGALAPAGRGSTGVEQERK